MATQDWTVVLQKETNAGDLKLHFTYSNASLGVTYDEYITPGDTTTDEWIAAYTASRIEMHDKKHDAFSTIQQGTITPVKETPPEVDTAVTERSDFIDLLHKYNQTRKAHALGIITDDGADLLAELKTTFKADYLEVFNGIQL